jgi:hypothetical protein
MLSNDLFVTNCDASEEGGVPVRNRVFAGDRTDIWHNNHNDVEFVICNSCLWCASCIVRENIISKCPLCHDNKIQIIPILFDQFIDINQDPLRHLRVEIGSGDPGNNDNTEELEVIL